MPSSDISSKPLTLAEAESLLSSLIAKRLYEEAYACLKQVQLLRQVSSWTEEKTIAVQNDDLERAIELKSLAAAATAKMANTSEESLWTNAAKSNFSAETIEDAVSLVEALHPQSGAKCRRLFVEFAPQDEDSIPLEQRLQFFMRAKRSMRVITALYTTHKDHVKCWRQLMSSISSSLTLAVPLLEKFDLLSEADQEVVRSQDKMQNFMRGTAKLAEAGLWLCASCVEGMVEEASAEALSASAMRFLTAHATKWGIASTLSGCDSKTPVDDLISKAAEFTFSSPNVEYCDLSLRPIAVQKQGGISSKETLFGCEFSKHQSGKTFHKTLLDVLQHDDISLPLGD